MVQPLAQQLDPAGLVDRRADDGEVEAVRRADVAIEHVAQVQGEIELHHRRSRGAPLGVELADPAERVGRGGKSLRAHRIPCLAFQVERRQ